MDWDYPVAFLDRQVEPHQAMEALQDANTESAANPSDPRQIERLVWEALKDAIDEGKEVGFDAQALNTKLTALMVTSQNQQAKAAQNRKSFLVPAGLSALAIMLIAVLFWVTRRFYVKISHRRHMDGIDTLLKVDKTSEPVLFPTISTIQCSLDRDVTISEKESLYQFLLQLNGKFSENNKKLDNLDIICHPEDCFVRFQSKGVVKDGSMLADIEIQRAGSYQYAVFG